MEQQEWRRGRTNKDEDNDEDEDVPDTTLGSDSVSPWGSERAWRWGSDLV